MLAAVLGTVSPKKSRRIYLRLEILRKNLLLPRIIFCQVHLVPQNATIRTLDGGDDEIYCHYRMNRDQLQMSFDSLHAPPALQLAGQHAGTFPSELGFLAWLYHNTNGCRLMVSQKEFGIEYTRLNRGIRAFETWYFEEHSFRFG